MNQLTDLQSAALKVIGQYRKSHPVTGKDVANRIGLKPRSTGKEGADMRSIINALRSKGWPICSSGDGYYYAYSSSELSEYIASLQGRIDKQQEACDGLKQGFEKIGAPPTIQFKIFKATQQSVGQETYYASDDGKRILQTLKVIKGKTYCDCKPFVTFLYCDHQKNLDQHLHPELQPKAKEPENPALF